MVIICLGGNDLLRSMNKKQAADNIREMICLTRKQGAAVVLIGVPALGLSVSPDPLYRENPDLSKGTIKQVDYAADGANVTVTRTVYLHDQVYFSDAFYTHFAPWQAIFEYGPGTEGIPEQKSD